MSQSSKISMQRKHRRRRVTLLLLGMALLTGFGIWIGMMIAGITQTEMPAEEGLPAMADIPDVSPVDADIAPPPDDNADTAPEGITPQIQPPAGPGAADLWSLILVNKANPIPGGYLPDLENITGDIMVDARIFDPLLRMVNAAKADGITLTIISGFRTYEQQVGIFERRKQFLIETEGLTEALAEASTALYIAFPGESEHHTGLAVDITTPVYTELDEGFEDTHAFAWLSVNAKDYGFVIRYPKDKTAITGIEYEPWHYRYVGTDAAHFISSNNLCLEEYLDFLQNGWPVDADGDDGGDEDDGDNS
ncbi:MAG: M15 family metallopeptidase [Oscillospiraceae bacterium]|nr:M15 family metallopeptidase [Oscillospiraceae bacterium]